MVDEKELESKAKARLTILIGCVRIIPPQTDGLENQLNSLLISEPIVSRLDNKCSVANQRVSTLFEPIGSKAVGEEIQLFQLGQPLLAHLDYSSKVIDPDSPYETQHVKVALLYDGLVYLAAFQEAQVAFNYRRHTAHLQQWLYGLLKKEDSWETRQVSATPFYPWIDFYILKEAPDALKGSSWHGMNLVSSPWSSGITAWTVAARDLSVEEAISREMVRLYAVCMEDVCRNYVSAHILNAQLTAENDGASVMIGHIVDETLGFYNIPFLNLPKRFQTIRSLGRELAQVFALMPNIEKLQNGYSRVVDKLNAPAPFSDFDEALVEMFKNNLQTRQETVFTRSVNEMLREDLSEIRSQLNNQVLLLSAFITFIAVVIAAFIK
ncbi:MAG: hypothetical protein V1857_07235 [archaeon]